MEACGLLYHMWKENGTTLDFTLRLLWECWYLDLEDPCFVHFTEKETEEVHRIFREVYRYGEAAFKNEGKYLWLTGYMLDVYGFLMYDITKYRVALQPPDIQILELADMEVENRFQKAGNTMPEEIIKRYVRKEKFSGIPVKIRKKLFTKKRLTPEEEALKRSIEEEKENFNKRIKEYFPGSSLIDEYFWNMYSITEEQVCV